MSSLARGYTSNPNGASVCIYTIVDQPINIPFTGNWNGTAGTMDFSGTFNGDLLQIHGSFGASISTAAPVFPMTVTGNITPATANVTAQIQSRLHDTSARPGSGTAFPVSVFVFAHAPASLVHSGTAEARLREGPTIAAQPRDGPDPCVLAQVDANGQLVGVSASTMQPYFTGVLSSQGQAVTILNNVPTPNVAGATMYVGYGGVASASSMLTSGVYQPVINVPGAPQCAANLANAPAPATPGALTGLFWNPNESGWGVHFTQRGSNIFAAWYTYDGSGKPKWYVSTCAVVGALPQPTCNGTLYEVVGPSFFGGAFNPALVSATAAGSLTVTFTNPNAASMTYTASGQTRTVALTRQPLGTGTITPAVDYTDIWWGGTSESGWGMAMAQQYGTNFLAWYVYDSSGKPTWLVATCTMSGTSCSGTLYRTTGPNFGPTFNPTTVQATQAGTISVNFTDANNAIINYTVDGVTATKSVTRQLF